MLDPQLFQNNGPFNPIQYFYVAANGTVNVGDFVKLVNGYLVSCAVNDDVCIGRAVAGGTQVSSLPTVQAPNGSTPVDNSQDAYGGLVKVGVALAFPGVAYTVYGLGVASLSSVGGGFNLGIDNGTNCSGAYFANLGASTHPTLVAIQAKDLCPVPAFFVTGAPAITSMKQPVVYAAGSTYQNNSGLCDTVYYQGKLWVAINNTGFSAKTPGVAGNQIYWQELPRVVVGIAPQANQMLGMGRNPFPTPVAKTTNYTVNANTDWGATFTTAGAGAAVTFTLPTPTAALAGMAVTLLNTVNYNMVVQAGSTGAGLLVVSDGTGTGAGDATIAGWKATFGGTNKNIGSACDCVCDGTYWYVCPKSLNAITIAT